MSITHNCTLLYPRQKSITKAYNQSTMTFATTQVRKGVLNQIQESVILAACVHFDISEQQLLSGTTYDFVYARQLCFFLIKQNTILNPKFIGHRFNLGRFTVAYGIEKIDATKNIYTQTLSDLKKIGQLASISCE